MSKYFLLQCLFILVALLSCNKVEEPVDNMLSVSSVFCDDLSTALVDLDEEILTTLLNPELAQFVLPDIDNDACYHDRNLEAFRDFINDTCDQLTATVFCCGCVETFPTISEIVIEVDSSGVEVSRILDLLSPSEDDIPLTFKGVH